MNIRRYAGAASLVVATWVLSWSAASAQVYVNPSLPTNGNGSETNPYNTWASVTFTSGQTYYQFAGTTYSGTITDSVAAASSQQITISVYDPSRSGAMATINSVDFAGASYASISGFILKGTPYTSPSLPAYAAVIIQAGSSYIDVESNVITNPPDGGIYVNGAGVGNYIYGNRIQGAKGMDGNGNASPGFGIIIMAAAGTTSLPTMVVDNTVSKSTCDGIMIISNYVMVSLNTVSENGTQFAGCSGIHLFSPTSTSGLGQNNTVSQNQTIGNMDKFDQDGNGILLDQWTSGNTVTENLSIQNDGGGITLYDASSNVVTQNTLFSNAENSGDTHSVLAELILNDSTPGNPLTESNTIERNSIVAYLPEASAVYLATTAGGNTFDYNTLAAVGPNTYDIGGHFGYLETYWNSQLGGIDLFQPPFLTTPTGGTYAYTFSSGTTFLIYGDTITFYGWNPTPGLYGTE